MTPTANKILVFPRGIFDAGSSLYAWDSIQSQIEAIEDSFTWLSRPEAESSVHLVQAIPCALIRHDGGKFYVLKQAENTRKDLSKKMSLIVGGHIDEANENDSFRKLISLNLVRELEEEVLLLTEDTPRPIGVIVDHSSIEASRHVAFLHEVMARDVSLRASEEFTPVAKLPGVFMDPGMLAAKRDGFDPWSRLLIEDYICPDSIPKVPRQPMFL